MNLVSIILLVGGKNTRLKNINNKSSVKPKALQKINSKYLLFYVIENFIDNNFSNFILPLGHYKKEFELFFKNKNSINKKKCIVFKDHKKYLESVKKNHGVINLLLVNTGINANKAERVLKIIDKLKLDEFGVTYGDGVGNVNINKLYKKHKISNCIASASAIKPNSQYGHFIFNKQSMAKNEKNYSMSAKNFVEKPILNEWVNIGYFFFKKESKDLFTKYYKDDLEMGIIKKIANKNKLLIYKHKGFWKSVDTQKDISDLKEILKND